MGTRLGHKGSSTSRTQKPVGHRAELLARNTYLELALACVLAASIGGLYTSATSVTLWIPVIMLAAVAILSAKSIHMGAVDWSVLLLCVFESTSLLLSRYRANSIRMAMAIAFFVLVYFGIRLTIRTPLQTATLSGLLGLGGAWLSSSGLIQFYENVKLLGAAGLTNLLAFRSRLISPPNPWIPGEWFTLLLLALPFSCVLPAYLLHRQRKWPVAATLVAPVLIAAMLCLSLSRSVFWSTVVFCFMVNAFLVASRLITLRAAGMLLGSALGGLVLILVCETALYPGIFKAYAGQHTTQVRSTEGRLAIWHRSLEVVRAHPLLGVGSSNAALALTSTADQEETTGFASRTFSLPLQVLVEKGMIGLLLYATFLTLVARQFILTMRPPAGQPNSVAPGGHKGGFNTSSIPLELAAADRSARNAMTCCFAAGLVAVLFRELVYSSLLEHSLTLVLAAVLSATICSPEQGT